MKLKQVMYGWMMMVLLFTSGVGQKAIAEDGAALFQAKACVACHGPEGKQPINNNIPKLAGQNAGYLIQQIGDIKSGARANGITAQMKPFAEKLKDSEIEAIAGYLSGL